jgi:hypothetical protein
LGRDGGEGEARQRPLRAAPAPALGAGRLSGAPGQAAPFATEPLPERRPGRRRWPASRWAVALGLGGLGVAASATLVLGLPLALIGGKAAVVLPVFVLVILLR